MTAFGAPHPRPRIAQILPFTDPRKTEGTPPKVIERGEGCYVFDQAGNRYLEMAAGLWCAGLGFSNEAVTSAITRQLQTLPYYHGFMGKAARPSLALAERLANMVTGALNWVLFANSGSEAIDAAIKLASYVNQGQNKSEKRKIITRIDAYHGSGVMSAALTSMEYCHHGFDLPRERVLRTGSPNYFRYRHSNESSQQFVRRRASELDDLIQREGPETIAAFIGEPIQGSGGVVIPPPGYWEQIQKVLAKHEILLIVDEVICGFHRTGKHFGSDTLDIHPDMMVVAKQLSAGFLPISGVIVSEEIYEILAEEAHSYGNLGTGFTYSGHPVAAAGAIAALDEYERLNIPQHVRDMEPVLSKFLQSLSNEPTVGEVRSVGLLGCIELDEGECYNKTGQSASQVVRAVVEEAESRGIIVRAAGNAIAICPPMIAEHNHLNEMTSVLGDSIRAVLT